MIAINRPEPGVVANRFNTEQFIATGSATLIVQQRDLRQRVILKNTSLTSGEFVFIGGATVTDSTGYRLDPGESQDFRTTAELYVITMGTNITVDVFEEFVSTGS